MKQQRMRTLINMVLALVLVVVCLVSLPAPGMAHVIGGSSWSAPLPVAEKSETTSELLTEEGQTIMLSLLEGSRDVEIAIDIPEDVYWYVTATVEDEQSGLWVSTPYVENSAWTFLALDGVENTMFYQGGGAQNITVSMTNQLPTNYVAEGEEAPAVDAVSADVKVTLHYITAAEVALLQPQPTEPEVQPAEVVETIEETQEAAPSEETEGTGSSEEMPVPEVPSPLHTLSATFRVPLQKEYPATMLTGRLLQCPTQYHPMIAIPLVNAEADSELKLLTGEGFPAMTRYTMDGETYLLYDSGTIVAPANAAITLDFSMVEEPVVEEATSEELPEEEVVTDEAVTAEILAEESTEENTEKTVENDESTQEQMLKLLVGGYEYSLAYAEAPVLDKTQAPFIMKGSTFVLPMTYQWNTIAPTVSVEQLKSDGAALVWEVMDADQWKAMENDAQLRLSVVGQAPQAGTYRLTVTWAENEMTLYSLQTVFYVRSGKF